MFRLDYCNSLLYGSPKYLINRLQKKKKKKFCPPHPGRLKVSKTNHITPHLQTVHWQPLDARIHYKICSLCFNDINCSGPQYLADLLKIMHLLANSTLLLTLAHGGFLLYTQKPMANVPFYTPYLIKLSETQNLLFLSNSP